MLIIGQSRNQTHTLRSSRGSVRRGFHFVLQTAHASTRPEVIDRRVCGQIRIRLELGSALDSPKTFNSQTRGTPIKVSKFSFVIDGVPALLRRNLAKRQARCYISPLLHSLQLNITPQMVS